MYHLYILKSKTSGNLYINPSKDLKRRLQGRNDRKVRSAASRAPFVLKYHEPFLSEKDARKRKVSLKKNRRALAQLRRRIHESLL